MIWNKGNDEPVLVKGEDLINDDGTQFCPPQNPLREKWLKLYPPTPKPENCQVCDGYSCDWCGRCPWGTHWRCPEEDRAVYDAWAEEYEAYLREHNPSMFAE